jgi:hypothetical protein
MNRTQNNQKKRSYAVPTLMRILLDNDIRWFWTPKPPYGPDETNSGKAPEYFNSDPLKSILT